MVVVKVNHQAELLASPAFSLALCWQVRKAWLIFMLLILVWFWPLALSELLLGLVFSALLVLLALLDFRYLLLYDKLVMALLAVGGLSLLMGRLTWEDACCGAALGGAFLGGLRLLVPQGMGWGDIKLATVLGCWLGIAGMLVCLYIAFISGGLYGTFIGIRKRSLRNILVPFGPFLALGGIVAFGAGNCCEGWVEVWSGCL